MQSIYHLRCKFEYAILSHIIATSILQIAVAYGHTTLNAPNLI